MSGKAGAIQKILSNLRTAHTIEKKKISSSIKRSENEQNIRQWFTSLTRRHNQLLQLCQHQRTIERRITFINRTIHRDSRARYMVPKQQVTKERYNNRRTSLQSEFIQSQTSFNRMAPRITENRLNIHNNISQNRKKNQVDVWRESQHRLQTLQSLSGHHFSARNAYPSTACAQRGRKPRSQSSSLVSSSSKRHYQQERFDHVFKDDLANLKQHCQRGISASQPQQAYKPAHFMNDNWNDTQFARTDLINSRAVPNNASFPNAEYFDDCGDNKDMSVANNMGVNHTLNASQPQFLSSQDIQSSHGYSQNTGYIEILPRNYAQASQYDKSHTQNSIALHQPLMDSQSYSQTQQPSVDSRLQVNPPPLSQTGSRVQQNGSNQMTYQADILSGRLPSNGANNVSFNQQIQYIQQPHQMQSETCMLDKRCVSLISPMNPTLTNQKAVTDAQKSFVLPGNKDLAFHGQGNQNPVYLLVNNTHKQFPSTANSVIPSENSMTLPSSMSQKTCSNVTASNALGQKTNSSLISGYAGSCRRLVSEPVSKGIYVNSSTWTPCVASAKTVMEQCGLGTDVAIVHSQEMADEKSRYLPLVRMIKLGLIQPGTCNLSFKHNEKVYLSNLLTDGMIQGVGGEMFLGPRHWLAAISGLQVKNVKKARAYDQVLYQNQPLITYLTKYERDSAISEAALCSSQSRYPGLQETQPHPEVLLSTNTTSKLATASPGESCLIKLLADCKVRLIDDKELLKSDKFLPPDYWSLPFSSVHLSQEFRDCIDDW